MSIINYTPHTVTVRDADGNDHIFPASGIVPRVEMVSHTATPLPDGTPTTFVTYGDAQLPNGHNIELFVPDNGPSAIRENGQIVAVRSLIRR
jgi:hypothetical protein